MILGSYVASVFNYVSDLILFCECTLQLRFMFSRSVQLLCAISLERFQFIGLKQQFIFIVKYLPHYSYKKSKQRPTFLIFVIFIVSLISEFYANIVYFIHLIVLCVYKQFLSQSRPKLVYRYIVLYIIINSWKLL